MLDFLDLASISFVFIITYFFVLSEFWGNIMTCFVSFHFSVVSTL